MAVGKCLSAGTGDSGLLRRPITKWVPEKSLRLSAPLSYVTRDNGFFKGRENSR